MSGLVLPAKEPGHPQPLALPAAPAGVFEDELPKLHPLCSLAQLQAQFSFLFNPQINMCSYIFNRETVFIRVGISFTSFSPPIRGHAPFMRETERRTKRKAYVSWVHTPARQETESPIREPTSLLHRPGAPLPLAFSLGAIYTAHFPCPVPLKVLAQGSSPPCRPVLYGAEQKPILC